MQKSIIIYQSHIDEFGGVSTFLYNWCLGLRNYYDITLVHGNANPRMLSRVRKLVKVKQWNEKEQYECDIVLRNSVWGAVPNNIVSKDNRYLEMRHANYKYLIDNGLLFQQYNKWDKTNEIIGCGEYVSKMSKEVMHDNPTTIKNILAPKRETEKIYHFISCTRLDPAKGWGRMQQMIKMLREANIKFQWDIFTPNQKNCDYEEVRFYKPRYDIYDYLANADYTVLLSDSEGLSYTVQESLQYQVPVICTDVGGNAELIKDGVNGYLVPLDMNFDINKIKKIPKCKEYENNALEKWLEYLGNSEYIEKEIIDMKYKVKVNPNFNNGHFIDVEGNTERNLESEWIVDADRKDYLLSHNAIIVIEEIKPEVKKKSTKKGK